MKKMRTLALSLLLLIAPAASFAQAFSDGKTLVSLGFGLPPGELITAQRYSDPNFTNYTQNNYGTVVLKLEHGLSQYFGIGLNLEYSGAYDTYKYDTNLTLRYNVTESRSIIAGYVRFNGHYPVGDKLDIYAGIGLGYLDDIDHVTDANPVSSQNTSHLNSKLDFSWQLTIGARYMVKPNFGMFFEVGYATTAVQVGLVF